MYISCLHKKEKMQANKIKKVYKGISPKSSENKEKGRQKRPFSGAAGRTWTGTDVTPRDFKSIASAYSATTACVYSVFVKNYQLFHKGLTFLRRQKF